MSAATALRLPHHDIDRHDGPAGPLLAGLLATICDADGAARRHFDHGRSGGDLDTCARAAQAADERAAQARALARAMIEHAFPGVSWSMIDRAGL